MSGFWTKGAPLDLDAMRSQVDPVADAVVDALYRSDQDAGVAALLEGLGRGSAALQGGGPARGLLGTIKPQPTVGGRELNLDWLSGGEQPAAPGGARGLLGGAASGGTFAERLRARLLAAHDGILPEWAELLCTYFDSTSQLPEWRKPDLLDRASQFALFYGTLDCLILCCGSLPWCYLDAKGVPVLASTQRLEGTRVYRRIWETSHFVVEAARPGGLGPEGQGIFFAQRVRLLHAAVRNRLLAPRPPEGWPVQTSRAAAAMRESADAEDWKKIGLPLNHEDMAYILLTFSYVAVSGLRKLGGHPSPEDADAYVHLWNVVGHVLGIPQSLMAETFEDAEALFEILLARVRQPSPKGQLLMRALLAWMEEVAPGRLNATPTILVTHLLGAENAEVLGIRRGTRHVLLAPLVLGGIRTLTRLSEFARRETGNAFSAAVRQALYTAVIGGLWDRQRAKWGDLARYPDAYTGNENEMPPRAAVAG